MDIRAYFGASSARIEANISRNEETDSSAASSDDSTCEQPPPKKKQSHKAKKSTAERKYCKSWEKEFNWLQYDEDSDGVFCKICKESGKSFQRTGGIWVTKPFKNWKKAVEKMKAHAKSECHIQASQAILLRERMSTEGSIVQQLQTIGMQERCRNRAAIKSFIRCTHFPTKQHIAHSSTFEHLIDLVVACGGQDLKVFIENAARNAVYTSRGAVVEFIEALGTWVQESILRRIQEAPVYSIMADECTDITTIEELSIFCRWVENGTPVECFLEILPLKSADAATIYASIVQCLKERNLQVSKIVGMGFDGAATFSGGKTGVQSRIKAHAPHVIFVHCHCHMLQLACVQAAKQHSRNQACVCNLDNLMEILPLLPKASRVFERGSASP